MILPKPSKRPRRKAKSRDLRAYEAHIHTLPCLVPGCTNTDIEACHVTGVLSSKTGLPVPRRSGAAAWALAPGCSLHHRTGRTSIHELGERGFEQAMGMPEGHLVRLALTNLAEWAAQ